MKSVFTAFESFAFKSFDFSGRASLLEYWIVMPTIWALILFLGYGDIVEFWGFLLAREVPPLNPLYWDAVVVFGLTIIPRLTLTVRRLHDSGQSGRWAKLPFISLISGIVLVLGIFSAIATTNTAGNQLGGQLTIFAIFAAMTFGAAESAWDVIFATAAILNAIGWDAIIAMLSELTTPTDQMNINRGISNAAQSAQELPIEVGSMLVVVIIMIGTPFVTAFLHLFFMMSPGKPDHALDKTGPIAGASLRRKGEVSDNPFAGYRYLYAKSPEQEAAQKLAAKQEIKSLYQQRVLGQQQTT